MVQILKSFKVTMIVGQIHHKEGDSSFDRNDWNPLYTTTDYSALTIESCDKSCNFPRRTVGLLHSSKA